MDYLFYISRVMAICYIAISCFSSPIDFAQLNVECFYLYLFHKKNKSVTMCFVSIYWNESYLLPFYIYIAQCCGIQTDQTLYIAVALSRYVFMLSLMFLLPQLFIENGENIETKTKKLVMAVRIAVFTLVCAFVQHVLWDGWLCQKLVLFVLAVSSQVLVQVAACYIFPHLLHEFIAAEQAALQAALPALPLLVLSNHVLLCADPRDVCPICWSDLSNDRVLCQLECQHIYCFACLQDVRDKVGVANVRNKCAKCLSSYDHNVQQVKIQNVAACAVTDKQNVRATSPTNVACVSEDAWWTETTV